MAGSPVERARQGLGIDSGVDHLDARDLRSGGGVDVDFVPPAGQAAGQIGHEGLRAAALRLTDGRHERRHNGDLHCATFIGPLFIGPLFIGPLFIGPFSLGHSH